MGSALLRVAHAFRNNTQWISPVQRLVLLSHHCFLDVDKLLSCFTTCGSLPAAAAALLPWAIVAAAFPLLIYSSVLGMLS